MNDFVPFVPAVKNLIEAVGESEHRLFVSLTEIDYKGLVRILDDLIDVVRDDENHILATVIELVGILIEYYED